MRKASCLLRRQDTRSIWSIGSGCLRERRTEPRVYRKIILRISIRNFSSSHKSRARVGTKTEGVSNIDSRASDARALGGRKSAHSQKVLGEFRRLAPKLAPPYKSSSGSKTSSPLKFTQVFEALIRTISRVSIPVTRTIFCPERSFQWHHASATYW